MKQFEKVQLSNEHMQVLEYYDAKITNDYGKSGFDLCEIAFEYWSVNGGDVWMKTEVFNGRNNFADLNPEHEIASDPDYLRDDLQECIEYGQTIFVSNDFVSVVEDICEDLLDDLKERDESFVEQFYPELLENF